MDRRSVAVAGEPVRVTSNGRRYFSKAHKEAVVAKCLEPGASLAAVALANGFNANLVQRWVRQRQSRDGLTKAKLVPVALSEEQSLLMPERSQARRAAPQVKCGDSGSMQIRIGGVDLVVHGVVDRDQLLAVLAVLLRSR
jgi:transposase-like protein